MSVSSVGFNPSVGTSGGHSSIRQARLDFNQLVQALQSGNLGAAQQAYNSFQQIQAGQTDPAATPTSAVATTAAANPVASDWSALGQALQSGNLSSAQSALGTLEQDAQTAWQTQLQQQAQKAESVYALMQGTQAGQSGPVPTGAATATTVQNDLTALAQALQSGDTSGAQKLLAQLEQDLQTSGQASVQNAGGHRHHHHHGGYSGLTSASAIPTPAASVSSTPTAASTSGSGAAA